MAITRRDWLCGAALLAGCERSRSHPRRARILRRQAQGFACLPPQAGHALLAQRFASLDLSHISLGRFPTRCERAHDLSRELGLELWVKRDDLASALFGGGKVRKLELLLAEAKALGRSAVITFGGAGSNQCLATALFAPRAGLSAQVALAPQPRSAQVSRQLKVLAATAAEVQFVAEVGRAEADATAAMQQKKSAPHVLPTGGTSPLGNLAFVAAALELDAQIRRGLLPEPAWIVTAAGTLGSAVGLALGLSLTERKTRVLAVRASSLQYSNVHRAQALYEATVRFIAARENGFSAPPFDSRRLVLESRELGAGYGRATPSGNNAARLASDLEGYRLDPTYTQKAFAAVLRPDRIPARGPVLLWLTQSAVMPPEAREPSTRLPRELHAYLD